jgi:hypothetical protein
MSARYYSPGLGAFTSIDSVMGGAQNPLSLNRYLYALANPATLQDPSGHYACSGNDPDCKYLQKSVKAHEKIRHAKATAKRERDVEDENRVTYRRKSTAQNAAADKRWRTNRESKAEDRVTNRRGTTVGEKTAAITNTTMTAPPMTASRTGSPRPTRPRLRPRRKTVGY